MNTLLRDVAQRGTAELAQRKLKRRDIYGKTGTSNDAVDAWFAAFAPGVVAVAWMGYDEPRSLGERESGAALALPIWIDYMAVALKGVPVAAPARPPANLVRAGDDWLYAEWQGGGWVERIGADGSVTRARPPPPPMPMGGPAAYGEAGLPVPQQ